MGDVIDLGKYRKRLAREEAKARERKSGTSGRGSRRERKAPLPEQASRDDDDAGSDDDHNE